MMKNDFLCAEQLWNENEPPQENFLLIVPSKSHVFMEGMQLFSSCPEWYGGNHTQEAFNEGENKRTVLQRNTDTGLEVAQQYTVYGTCVEQVNTVKNRGTEPVTLQHISSAYVQIPIGGVMDWLDENRFTVWYAPSNWSQEGQWKHTTLSDLGFAPMRGEKSGCAGHYAWRSEGSWSTGRYYPLILIEDHEMGRTWFFEHEGGITWEISLGKWRSPDRLEVDINSASLHHDGFSHTLMPGESYTTTPAVYGYAEGNMEAALRVLTDYRRQSAPISWGDRPIPVCYNVYMGGIWGEPTDTNLIPLIDAAAEAGCEVFCIDAGWYRPAGDRAFYNDLGDYVPDPVRFGEKGLEGILAYMKQKGLIPGLWFEFESVNCKMKGASLSDTAMAKRFGKVFCNSRGIYDLCDEKVFNYLLQCVDNAYRLGMRYIKNDHNFNTGIGFGDHVEDFNFEQRKRMEALYRFIDTLTSRYPDLIIENCGSGAMRADHGTLRHFHLQSTSDQERFERYPSIVAGSLAMMAPEKAGNWVHTYASTWDDYEDLLTGKLPESFLQRYLDPEKTIFPLVNGFLGVFYLTGRIDLAPKEHRALIKEAIDVYRSMRDKIKKSYPVYPDGFSAMGKKGFSCAGLTDDKTLYLAVWKTGGNEDVYSVDLSPYGAKKAEQIFPQKDEACRFTFAPATGRLTLCMEGAENMARLFAVSLA